MLALAFMFISLIGVQSQQVISVPNPNNITIAYGSCLNTFDEYEDIRTVMTSIAQTQPNLWMWLGDAIYLDGESFFFGALPGIGYDVNDVTYIQNTFNSLKNNPFYSALTSTTPVIGTWDDHDFAYNDADGSFEHKDRNKGFYLDFLNEPADSPRRNQQGVYSSYYIGEDRLIKVILLDIRYNRDEESTISSVLNVDFSSDFNDMLGEEQWAWLDGQLQDPTGTYTLIVSGTQFLPDDRPILPNWYRDSLNRLYDLINTHQKSGVVFLSGDVHFAEMIKHPCPSRIGYRGMYEFTSSGLTHSASFVDLFDGLFSSFSGEGDRYFEKNFAVLKFVRAENSLDPPNLVFEARDANGNVVLTREVPYSDLVYDAALAASYTGCGSDGSDTSDDGNSLQGAVDTGRDIIDSIRDIFSKGKNSQTKTKPLRKTKQCNNKNKKAASKKKFQKSK